MKSAITMLERMVAIIGPPAAGKTTLTMRLAKGPDVRIFRLREHVPDTILAATATSADQPGWIDDVTVALALRAYVAATAMDNTAKTVLLDNFPGSGTQVRLLLGVLGRLAAGCLIQVVELVVDPQVREQRVDNRRVCHQCEHDPIHDPRIPAQVSQADPDHCARCGGVLHPRRGDSPRLLAARTRRYEEQAIGIRAAFVEARVTVMQVDSGRPVEMLVSDLCRLLTSSKA